MNFAARSTREYDVDRAELGWRWRDIALCRRRKHASRRCRSQSDCGSDAGASSEV